MVRIGAVNIDTSHPKSFAEYLNQGNRARYVAIYNDGFRSDDEVNGFIETAGLEKRCETLEELADCVDIGFIHGCNWNKHIEYAMPFIRKEKPVFIDKPIVGSLKDCITIESLVDKGAIILGSSSARYAKEIVDFLAVPEEERGKIVNIFGTAGVDEFNYAVHIVEAICELAGADAVSTDFIGRNCIDGKTCESFFVRFSNNITAIYNTFQGVWQPFDIVIMTTKTTYSFRINSNNLYAALLDRICDYWEYGKEMAPIKALTESVKIMLAARISRGNGGGEFKIKDIPLDDPGYDGNKFEKAYAKTAQNLYLK